MSNCTSLQQKIGTPVIRKEMGRRERERENEGEGRQRRKLSQQATSVRKLPKILKKLEVIKQYKH